MYPVFIWLESELKGLKLVLKNKIRTQESDLERSAVFYQIPFYLRWSGVSNT